MSSSIISASKKNASYQHRTFRHKKSGREYQIVGVGCMQAKDWGTLTGPYDVFVGVDMEEVVIYKDVKDNHLWVRPYKEFFDGRFEPIDPSLLKEEKDDTVSVRKVSDALER